MNGPPTEFHYLSYATDGAPQSDRGSPNVGWDWDVGNIKAECGYHGVVTGLGQTDYQEIDAIACNVVPSPNPSLSCNTVDMTKTGNHGFTGSDWAPGFYKNQCGYHQYLKGVSKLAGTRGQLSKLLCCNWN